MRAQEFLDYLQRAKSKNTYREYRYGLKKFSEWYGKDLDTILQIWTRKRLYLFNA